MQTAAQGQESASLRMQPGQQQRAFIGLGAAVDEERAREAMAQRGGQGTAEFDHGRGQVDRRRVLQLPGLLQGRACDGRVAVAGVHHGHAGVEVRVASTPVIKEILHFATDQHGRIGIEMVEAREEVFPLAVNEPLGAGIHGAPLV